MNNQKASDLASPGSSERENNTTDNHGTISKQASPIPRYASFDISKSNGFNYNHKGHRTLSSSSSSSSSSSTSASTSPKPSVKASIDVHVREILGIASDNVSSDDIWPYSTDTLNEIIRFKVQQEITKQELARQETSRTALELLSLAKEMNVSEDLVPFLFMPGTVSTEHMRVQIYKIQQEPNELLQKAQQDYNNSKTPEISLNKRKFSEVHLPSFHETAESIKTYSSSVVSPLRSPNKSPATTHRRVISDSSDATTHGTSTLSPPAQGKVVLPFPQHPPATQRSTTSNGHHQSNSPSLPQQPYPSIYYQQYQPIVDKSKSLGSPYSHKYQGYPVAYYGASSPGSTYVLPPPPTITQPQCGAASITAAPKKQTVPSHQFEQTDSGNRFSAVTHDDISPQHKKKKQNNINFMITTPKNPPARKYNNPKEKSS